MIMRFIALFALSCAFIPAWAIDAEQNQLLNCEGVLEVSVKTPAPGEAFSITDMHTYSSDAQLESVELAGPHLLGRPMQMEVETEKGQSRFIQGRVIDAKDDWSEFQFLERSTNRLLTVRAEHARLGQRRYEFLAAAGSEEELVAFPEEAIIEEANQQEWSLGQLRQRDDLERKIDWYRTKNGRNLRTTMYDRQKVMGQLNRFLKQGQKREAVALLRRTFRQTEIAAIVISSYKDQIKDLMKPEIPRSPMVLSKIAEFEATIAQHEPQLAETFGDYQAFRGFLEFVKENKDKRYSPAYQANAIEVLDQLGFADSDRKVLPKYTRSKGRPALSTVQQVFTNSPGALIAKLRADLWAERKTFAYQVLSKLSRKETIRNYGGKLLSHAPNVLQNVAADLLKTFRDARAHKFDVPQITRIRLMEDTVAAKLDELENIYAPDQNMDLLVNFSRALAAREIWDQMKAEAKKSDRDADFLKLMEKAEETGKIWGQLSEYYEESAAGHLATIMLSTGIGSGWLYYHYAPHDGTMWKMIESVLPFFN